jgi:hypothetical protein
VNLHRAFHIFERELRLSPRSPVVLFAVGLPILMTFLLASVFGTLFTGTPRLAIVDHG